MNEHNKLSRWLDLFKVLLILSWYYTVSAIVTLILYSTISNINDVESYITVNNSELMIIIYLMVFFGIWAFDKSRTVFINSFKKWNIKEVFSYIGLAIVIYYLSNFLTAMLLPYFPEYSELENVFIEGDYILSFIAIVVAAPIIEEYIFRNKIQTYLKNIMGLNAAIIIQALLFGMMHAYVIQTIYATLIGLAFGYLNEKKGSLKPGIVMHITINFIGWIITYFVIH